ncbi:MAG TPA: hypothetical protein VFP56_03245 [Candidatus Limnocylindrales bacterium]|nr:hypothetical protein [Candidatus Limnocylindrales bacterium]
MNVLLIRRRRPAGEPDVGRGHGGTIGRSPTLQLLDGTTGAGRICAALLDLGVTLDGVRQAVFDASAPVEDLESIDLAERARLVVLGSHLVNAPEPERRAAFLDLAARHVELGGTLIVEHHPVDWAETAGDVEPTPGSALGMVNVRRDPPFVSAVSVFDAFGRVVRQPFRARVLSEAELVSELDSAGFAVARRLGPTWIEARRTTG